MAEETQYQPKDAIGKTIEATAVTTLAGTFTAAVQNALEKRNVGSMGIFTRHGGTIGMFGKCFLFFSVGYELIVMVNVQRRWAVPLNS